MSESSYPLKLLANLSLHAEIESFDKSLSLTINVCDSVAFRSGSKLDLKGRGRHSCNAMTQKLKMAMLTLSSAEKDGSEQHLMPATHLDCGRLQTLEDVRLVL